MTLGAALVLLACSQMTPHPAPAPVRTPAMQPAPSPTQEINDRFVKEISARIAGHENDPADQVFKNLQIPWLKNAPAGRFLRIMNFGYSRALGVTCTHCHVENDFASDDKRPKRAAREMADMHHAINEQLAKMQNLDPEHQQHFINCTTCHRGAIDPVASDRAPAPRQ